MPTTSDQEPAYPTKKPIEKPTEKSAGTGISAVDFTPLDSQHNHNSPQQRSGAFKRPATLALLAVVLTSAVILWFLLTARSVIVTVEPANSAFSIHGGLVFTIGGNTLMRPGDYILSAKSEGYKAQEVPFTVGEEAHQSLTLSLEKLPGLLAITTTPEDAEIKIDGVTQGITPLTIENLQPGDYLVNISKPGYFSQAHNLTIEGRGITQTLTANLQSALGNITLTTSPAGAAVSVTGKLHGTTPITVPVMETGEEVSIQLPGYQHWQQILQAESGTTKEHPVIELQPALAIATINSTPSGANVTLNDQFAGTTPLELPLEPSKAHRLTLFLNGYQSLSQKISLQSGEARTLNLKLNATVGTIRLSGSPANAQVWIDGQLAGNTNQNFTLPARAHQFELKKSGYAPQTISITPKPGVDQVARYKLLTQAEAQWASTPRQITDPTGQQLKLFRPQSTFTMGASRREAGRRANEVMRDVRLERPFYLATTEVTNANFKRFNRRHSSSHANRLTLDSDRQPAVNISWQQAALYCNWLSEQAGLPLFYKTKDGKVTGISNNTGYRLPTEAEWAWAARHTDRGMLKYPWPGEFPPAANSGKTAGNYADTSASKVAGRVIPGYNDGHAVSAPVGSFAANSKGLYDLGGNVAEWVNDYYGIGLSLGSKIDVDPTGPEQGEYRVIRGSSWRQSTITELRLSFRDYGNDGRDDLGFRVARYAQ